LYSVTQEIVGATGTGGIGVTAATGDGAETPDSFAALIRNS